MMSVDELSRPVWEDDATHSTHLSERMLSPIRVLVPLLLVAAGKAMPSMDARLAALEAKVKALRGVNANGAAITGTVDKQVPLPMATCPHLAYASDKTCCAVVSR